MHITTTEPKKLQKERNEANQSENQEDNKNAVKCEEKEWVTVNYDSKKAKLPLQITKN